MVFKNFRFQIILRVLILTVGIGLLTWCLFHTWYLRAVYAGVAVVIMAVELIWYVDRFNRDVRSFIVSLHQRDFNTHFQAKGRSKSFDELYEALNGITEVFKAISAEKEAQFRYLQMLVEHLRVGILSLDETGKIHLANQALKNLLHKDVLFSLKSLASFDPSLVETLGVIRSGETRLVKIRVENETLQLSIHASEFRLEGKYYKLISMQNIRSELDAREMEAWQKLIRVLTHEIMNSVSPVTSLSETLHGMVIRHREEGEHDADFFHTLEKGLEAIKVRSEGLYAFTQSYRKLTSTPKVSLQDTDIRALIGRVSMLMEPHMKENGIHFETSSVQGEISVDPHLIEQVLINLLQNAMEAVRENGNKDPSISLRVSRNTNGKVCICVRDNGKGIDATTAEKIFIPFFTTKRNGSGIGLAISKQILQVHGADIQFRSEAGKGTEFMISFWKPN